MIPAPDLKARPTIDFSSSSLFLNGRWLFRTHGALRADEATLALHLKAGAWPAGGEAGLLDGDIWRNGVLRLRVNEAGCVVASLGEQADDLRSRPMPLGQWCWVVVTYSRQIQQWCLTVAHSAPGGGPNDKFTVINSVTGTLRGEGGMDLDTITLGGPRLAGATQPFIGRIASCVVSNRAWCAEEITQAAGSGEIPDAEALHWRFGDLHPLVPGLLFRVNSSGRTLSGRELRKDSTSGDGGSRGSNGGFVYRADLAQPEPLECPSDGDFAAMGIGDPCRAMVSEAPSWSWETALPCGNGEQGALVLGRPLDEVIILNRAGLFLPLYPSIPPPQQAAHLPELRSLLAQGIFQGTTERLMEFAAEDGFAGEKRWTDPFIPAGFLRINTPDAGDCTSYLRGVDYPTGTVAVRWQDAAGWHLRQTFASRADGVTVVRISGAPVRCALSLATHDARATLAGEDLPDFVGEAWTHAERSSLECGYRYASTWPGSLRECRNLARVIVRGGRQTVAGDVLTADGADEVLILIRTAIRHDGKDIEDSRAALDSLPADFASLLGRHAAAHGGQWSRTRLRLGGTADDHRLPTERLFERSRVGAFNPALMEKAFDACRYLALSASGKTFPPALQGIWSGTWEPSWSGDYTQNGNLQCAVDGHLAGNMPEAMEGFFTYLESQIGDYRTNARTLFNARGILIPSRTSSHGLLNHFCSTWPMTFWTAGAAWNARYFYDYWLHTGDRGFLRNRAIPFMREVALFYEDTLVEGAAGQLHFSPSYSPENDSPSTGSQACTDATMDHAAARELLTNLLAACRHENLHAESWPVWESMLGRLPTYRINADGAVAEWGDPRLADRYEHRHASHLYALYQGLPEDIEADAPLREAFAVAIEKRMIPRRLAGGGVMGFGMVQLGVPAASLRLRKAAFETVDWLTHSFWVPQSMVTTHNPRSVFNTDITGGLVRLVTLLLVSSRPGRIDLLPALPDAWPEGCAEGILCRGAITIEKLLWNRESVSVVLRSREDQEVEVRLEGGEPALSGHPASGQDRLRVALPKDRSISLTLARANHAE